MTSILRHKGKRKQSTAGPRHFISLVFLTLFSLLFSCHPPSHFALSLLGPFLCHKDSMTVNPLRPSSLEYRRFRPPLRILTILQCVRQTLSFDKPRKFTSERMRTKSWWDGIMLRSYTFFIWNKGKMTKQIINNAVFRSDCVSDIS